MLYESEANWLKVGRRNAHPAAGENVVITGMSGCFPESRTIAEFHHNLATKADMVTYDTRRWQATHPEIPKRAGKIYDVEKFDAGFFGVHKFQANAVDPLCRILMEKAFECVLDAGINPEEIAGSNTGVFVGACASESEKFWFYDNLKPKSCAITGCHRSMLATRVSYALKLNGPAFVMDTACSSSFFAFEQAYKSIREGKCERAIVCGSNLCLHPYVTLQFSRLGVLSLDGACKCFDDAANGYTRSEAICAIMLQRSKEARRVYAEIVHSKVNSDGYKEQGITYPSGVTQMRLIREVYDESRIDPSEISYMEAHGTGTKVGDPEELKALDEIFLPKRSTPLLIGSVKSNIGHTEPTSGLCSIVKVILSMETGKILPNMNYKTARRGVKSLEDGKMIVVTENTPWPDGDNSKGLVGINSFGFGGANCHTILKRYGKIRQLTNTGGGDLLLPKLVCFSGRTFDAIQTINDNLQAHPEFLRLIHEAFKYTIDGHIHRAYTLLTSSNPPITHSSIVYEKPKRLIFIFGGVDKLWPRTIDLFALKQFSAAIEHQRAIVADVLGLNLTEMLVNYDCNNRLHQYIATLSLQIALVDVLTQTLGLQADNYIGFSLGHLTCAYLDEALTMRECFTIAGRIGALNQPIDHRHLDAIISDIIKQPRKLSGKWLMRTNNQRNHSIQQLHASDLIEILANELNATSRKITVPKNVVLLEIGSAILESFNKKALHDCVKSLKLIERCTQREESLNEFFHGLGRIFLAGYDMNLHLLYPPIQFPVSRGTPMLGHLIKWNHSKDWYVTKYRTQEIVKTGYRLLQISIKDEYWRFLAGHVIDQRNLFPATGYLEIVREVMGTVMGRITSNMILQFDNVRFLRATAIPAKGKVALVIMVHKGSGDFEVIEEGQSVVTGTVKEIFEGASSWCELNVPQIRQDALMMTQGDIYKELRLRGYQYKNLFKGIMETNIAATYGKIKWNGNWVTFLDNILQMRILQMDSRHLYVPIGIKRIIVDAKHLTALTDHSDEMVAYAYPELDLIRCGGVEMRGFMASAITKRKHPSNIIESYRFTPNHTHVDTFTQSLRIFAQLAVENSLNSSSNSKKLKIIEIFNTTDSILIELMRDVFDEQPLLDPQLIILAPLDDNDLESEFDAERINIEKRTINDTTDKDAFILICNEFSTDAALQNCYNDTNTFIISMERQKSETIAANYQLLASHCINNENIYLNLLRSRRMSNKKLNCIEFPQDINNLDWLKSLQSLINNRNDVVLYSNQQINGVLGLINCLQREIINTNEHNAIQICCVLIENEFDPKKGDFFNSCEQLQLGMVVNVYKDGVWGTYRHHGIDGDDGARRYAEHAYVNVTVRGDLSSLAWLEGPLQMANVERDNLVQVCYGAINFRDVMTASGRISVDAITTDRFEQECVQGFEFAGVDMHKRRVMGMLTSGALATLVRADDDMLVEVPSEWSLEQAVTVPVVYNTVLYAFFMRGNGMKPGQKVLIHSGSGGVGQAAIRLALHYNCDVFTTVGNEEKRKFLLKTFPSLKPDHIASSRNTKFEQLVMNATHGCGVDYVLNSLVEDKLQASVRCLARGGTFLEIGKFDLALDNDLNAQFINKGASFHGIMLDGLFKCPRRIKARLMQLLIAGINAGAVQPLPLTCFNHDQLEDAFRFMSTGKHIGKVVVKIREETQPVHNIHAIPRFYSNDDNFVSIIIGGLGGFGLELADWLILRGCKRLILTSRSGIRTGYQAMRLRLWKSYGVRVNVVINGLKTEKDCRQLLLEAGKLGEVYAIFNLAVNLRDALFENQDEESFHVALEGKAMATQHLDKLTRQLCDKLRFFVVFSSISCGRGNIGQTNYGYSNSVMERICEQRRKDNLPGLAIQWGAIGDVGLLAELAQHDKAIGGTLPQPISSCLAALDYFLTQQQHCIVASMVVAEKKATGAGYGGVTMVECVVNILGLRDLKTVSLHSTLAELGMDSMMAVEIKQTLEREYEVYLTPQDIRVLTFARLQELSTSETSTDNVKQPPQRKGVQFLLRFINDEACSKIPRIRLRSNVDDVIGAKKAFLLPGVEGFASILEDLCTKLAFETIGLQFSYDNPPDTLQEMADQLLPYILDEVKPSDEFNLIAYSYGCTIAIELALKLEQHGLRGKILLIDGAHEMMLKLTEQQVNVKSQAEFETTLLCNIFTIYMPLEIVDTYKDELLSMDNYMQRIEFVLAKSPQTVHGPDYLRKVCIAFYKRVNAVVHYTHPSDYKLQSPITLFKPTRQSVLNVRGDYGIGDYAKSTPQVRVVEGDHYTILGSAVLAAELNAIINDAGDGSKNMLLGKDGVVEESIDGMKRRGEMYAVM